MDEIINGMMKERDDEIARLKRELDAVQQSLQWTHDKLVDAELAYRRAANELMRVVETPDPDSAKMLLALLDEKCGFIFCERCKQAAEFIRKYVKGEVHDSDPG